MSYPALCEAIVLVDSKQGSVVSPSEDNSLRSRSSSRTQS